MLLGRALVGLLVACPGATHAGPRPPTLAQLDQQARLVLERTALPGPQAPGARPLQRDPALDRVALENCLELAERPPRPGGAAGLVDLTRLRHLLQVHGVVDGAVLPLAAATHRLRLLADLPRLLREPTPGGLLRPTHYGLALHETGPTLWVTVLLVHRLVQLEPLPRSLPVGHTLMVRGHLQQEATRPRVLYTGPGGLVHEAELQVAAPVFVGEIPLIEGLGTYRLQVLVTTPRGPAVAANFTVEAGRDAPILPVVTLLPASPAFDVAGAEEEARRLLEATRQTLGLPPLQLDARLAHAARQHSQEMLGRGYFAHVSPSTGAPEQRLQRVGLVAERQAENIAIAPDVRHAHRELLESPSHRLNLLDPEMTHVGLGVALGGGRVPTVFLTQLFARRPRELAAPAPSASPATLLGQANSQRRTRGLSALTTDPELQELASRVARWAGEQPTLPAPAATRSYLAERRPPGPATPELVVLLFRGASRALVQQEALVEGSLLAAPFRQVGLAQQQVVNPPNHEPASLLVVLLAP
jgi:uncharacterized protein YkwD